MKKRTKRDINRLEINHSVGANFEREMHRHGLKDLVPYVSAVVKENVDYKGINLRIRYLGVIFFLDRHKKSFDKEDFDIYEQILIDAKELIEGFTYTRNGNDINLIIKS